jgi:predicted dehydrogenase
MRKIKAAVIGAGFMGKVHTEGIRRLGNVEVVAAAAVSKEEAQRFGELMSIERVTDDYRELIADPEIEAVHVCTPNALHAPVSIAAMEAGKHVLCEKPLAMSAAEAQQMLDVARRTGVVHCVNHNLRYYPVLQHVRQMIARGDLGEILIVQGTYVQDWLLYDTDYNWRLDVKDSGPLRVVADVGSHWMDLIQHLTGLRITALCADMETFHKKRKRPKVAIETFAGKTLRPEEYDEVEIPTEDYGAVLLHLGERARGAYTVSQMAVGNKNRFHIEIYGTKAGVMWNQEMPDQLWIGHRNDPNQLIVKDPSLLAGPAAGFADLPGGHSEGYDDTHKQVYKRFYRRIADPSAPIDFPTFEDGVWGMQLLEKIMESHKSRSWVKTA